MMKAFAAGFAGAVAGAIVGGLIADSYDFSSDLERKFRIRSTNYPDRSVSATEPGDQLTLEPGDYNLFQIYQHPTTPGHVQLAVVDPETQEVDTDQVISHAGFLVYIKNESEQEDQDLFAKDSSFLLVPALNGVEGAFSLRSFNYPDRYIRHSSFRMQLDKHDGSALFAADASFHFDDE